MSRFVSDLLQVFGFLQTGTPVSSTNKTDCHNITEILLKVVLNTINLTKGETIHRMYRNRDYFGDGSVHDMWMPLTIQTI